MLRGGSMDKYRSYLWREFPNDNIWRIQTPNPEIKRKLNNRILESSIT